ncbi:MAG: DUF262 domain-containing protein [Prevotellaceae bacterium]|nr:DUF262 domain-containing protein [Prevotellaceae bacterium]
MNKTNLLAFLTDKNVRIPQLQRDYVQGSDKAKEIRDLFICDLVETLSADTPEAKQKTLHLDFIYGSTYEEAPASGLHPHWKEGELHFDTPNSDDNEPRKVFLPLDGQQRLTSLWLLHWMLCPETEADAAKKLLSHFSYATRSSSRRFCAALVAHIGDGELKQQLKTNKAKSALMEASWFLPAWQKDPTVNSMIEMLVAIGTRLGEVDTAPLWKRLQEGAITFTVIEIQSNEFRLTDELYIKMNNRGRMLTDWECDKAKAIECLGEVVFTEENAGLWESLQANEQEKTPADYFSFRVDGRWQDFFWHLSRGEESPLEDHVQRSDEMMRYFFTWWAEYRYYHYNTGECSDKMHVFKSAKEITLLFQVLNKLHEIGYPHGESAKSQDQEKEFLETAFGVASESAVEVRLHFTGREGNESRVGDLFRLLCEGKLERRHQVLVYYLLLRLVKYNEKATGANLHDFLRVVRNFLYGIREENKKMAFTSGIELKELSRYAKSLDEVLGEKEVYAGLSSKEISEETSQNVSAFHHEVEKAKWICAHPAEKTELFRLEEHDLLRGFLRNLPWQVGSGIDINKLCEAFFAIFGSPWLKETEKPSDKLVARALVACGFQGILNRGIRKYTWWAYCFGGDEPHWRFVLTYHKDMHLKEHTGRQNLLSALQRLFKLYIEQSGTPEERLQAIIDNFLMQTENKKPPLYYLVKYPDLWSGKIYHFAFTYDGEVGTKVKHFVRCLGDNIIKPMGSQTWNPFARAVRSTDRNKLFPIDDEYDPDSEKSLNYNEKKFALYFWNDAWYLSIPSTEGQKNEELENIVKGKLQGFTEMVYHPHDKENDIRYIIRPAAHSNSDLVEFGISIAEKLIALI